MIRKHLLNSRHEVMRLSKDQERCICDVEKEETSWVLVIPDSQREVETRIKADQVLSINIRQNIYPLPCTVG